MNYNFENQKVLITGASGGIGNLLCKKFSQFKCKLIFTSSDNEKLNFLKKEYGDLHSYYLLDFLDTGTFSEKIKMISDEHSDIDILIRGNHHRCCRYDSCMYR